MFQIDDRIPTSDALEWLYAEVGNAEVSKVQFLLNRRPVWRLYYKLYASLATGVKNDFSTRLSDEQYHTWYVLVLTETLHYW